MTDIDGSIRQAAEVTEADLDRLHRRFALRADQAGLVDVAYRTVDSPVGSLLLAATPRGLVQVAFESQGHDRVVELLASRLSPRVLHLAGRLDPAARQLEEYFERRRQSFDLALDLRLAHGFRREVLQRLLTIEYGSTASYGQVASAAGRPRAVRAVGSACATNPLPVVVPCHRVLRADGGLGGYLGGLEAKTALLALEGATRGLPLGIRNATPPGPIVSVTP